MTPKERLLKALRTERVDRPPVTVPTQNATLDVMKAAGVYWPEALQKAEPMATLAMACQEIYGLESIRLPFDINVEAETMGCVTRYGGETDPPMSAPKNRDQLDELVYPDRTRTGRMAETIEAVRLVSERKPEDIPLIVALGTPFEVLCTVYNFDHMREDMKSDHGRLEAMLENLLTLLIDYGLALERAGADVMMLVDGTSQTLVPKQFRRFSAPYTKRLIDRLSVPTILHICGNPSRLIKDMADTGASALSLDWPVPIGKAREDAGGRVALIGTLDVNKLSEGTPDDVVAMVRAASDDGLDIIAPGCGVIPSTPLGNIRAYVDEVKSMSRGG